MLNVKQIIEEGLLKLDETKGKPAQVGYDLTLKSINKVGYRIGANMYGGGNIGKVLKDKTILTTYTPLDTIQLDGVTGWLLHPNTYDKPLQIYMYDNIGYDIVYDNFNIPYLDIIHFIG